ncbi:hypothetical protein Bca52824_084652 [Brassica carinata]|uniref:TRAM domain-containing protein n=1 Tax=Brassica carinata TaxID=52824 RepID=A0A8X7PMI5_BRACI|nr:hypothetical protein Bca52824_084652 [Brassica carinata]
MARTTATASEKKTTLYYLKRGQTVELFCESLGFKGKGICKVHGTGFVVMCDRALPSEHFLGRVTRRKGSYAEVSESGVDRIEVHPVGYEVVGSWVLGRYRSAGVSSNDKSWCLEYRVGDSRMASYGQQRQFPIIGLY